MRIAQKLTCYFLWESLNTMLSVLFSTEACYTIKENDKTFFFRGKKTEFCVMWSCFTFKFDLTTQLPMHPPCNIVFICFVLSFRTSSQTSCSLSSFSRHFSCHCFKKLVDVEFWIIVYKRLLWSCKKSVHLFHRLTQLCSAIMGLTIQSHHLVPSYWHHLLIIHDFPPMIQVFMPSSIFWAPQC